MLVKIIFIGGFLLTTVSAFAQNRDNYLDLDIYTATNVTLNSAELLENEITATNAIHLVCQTKDRTANVYASIPAGIKTSSNQYIPTSNIVLTLRSTDVTGGQLKYSLTGDIPLTTSPQLLFQQNKKRNDEGNWYYDVTLNPIGYNIVPGTYYFTIQFTMTQP